MTSRMGGGGGGGVRGVEVGGEMGRTFILVLLHGLPEAPPFPLTVPASNAAPVARHGSRLRAFGEN